MLQLKSNEYSRRFGPGATVVLDGGGDEWRVERLYVAAYLLEIHAGNAFDGVLNMVDHEGTLSVQVNNSGQRDAALEKAILEVWEMLIEYSARVMYIQSRDMAWHDLDG